MQHILSRFDIDLETAVQGCSYVDPPPEFVKIDGCVILLEEYERSKHVNLRQFPDRTGYECFVNHVHFSCGSKVDFEKVLERAAIIRVALRELRDGRFQIVVSVARDDATLRFHKYREGEKWLTDNLDEYEEEAILAIEVDAWNSGP